MTARVQILWTRTEEEWGERRLQAARSMVPRHILDRMPRYRRWQDRQMGLLGKLLLRKGLMDRGQDPVCLTQMSWSEEGKPALPGPRHFNISHSGRAAACALSADTRLGLDVEDIKPVALRELVSVFTPRECEMVRSADNPDAKLCEIWTFKEAVIKADGRGVGIDLQTFDCSQSPVRIDADVWHVQRVELHPDFRCHLASDQPHVGIAVQHVEVDALLFE